MGRKGSNSERELVRIFIENGWQALRIAGSGKFNLGPDVIAGKPGKLLIIECKSTKKDKIYVNKEEVSNVINYALRFGAEAWYGFRFNRHPWKFLRAHELAVKSNATRDSGVTFEMITPTNSGSQQ